MVLKHIDDTWVCCGYVLDKRLKHWYCVVYVLWYVDTSIYMGLNMVVLGLLWCKSIQPEFVMI